MLERFSDPRAIEWVLLFVLLEAAVLWAAWRRTGRGLAPAAIVACLLPGAFLMLAVRAALAGQGGRPVAAWLLAALAAHLVDLGVRWRAR
ncbi:MAG: hypothetical protein MUF07_13675 [Steroidobacteraceae bacterium]|jgi:hypothetical protein|nr:hypothetical protein [Steroidobacteraceae bacterium]